VNYLLNKRRLLLNGIKMKKIFDLELIRKELDVEDWQEDDYNPDMQTRRVFLGTVFSLLPSGKYYTPWANSNVDECSCCHGSGTIPGHKSVRIWKRNQKRYENMCRLGVKLGREYSIRHYKACNAARNRWRQTCPVCQGLGSKEAYQDECWWKQAEKELNSIGCNLTSGECDPCDLFVEEYCDIPEENNS
jgi:hypothetical protein